MKKFVYQVRSFEFVGYEAWGDAWKQAKAKAIELHAPMYRMIIKNGEIRQEAYCNGEVFLRYDLTKPEDIKVW